MGSADRRTAKLGNQQRDGEIVEGRMDAKARDSNKKVFFIKNDVKGSK